ncbi:MAG TPA: hypothetical protein PLY80_07420 [Pseudomonadota bacterium]|nr:hypothetical protein [Pseudomonadota bacterium]
MSDEKSSATTESDSQKAAAGPDNAYRELRELLLSPEQRELEDLRRRLDRPAVPPVEIIASTLPSAFTLASQGDKALSQAMLPLVEGSIAQSVRQHPDAIVEAIFPIIGAAISRAVRETLARMMQQTTYAMEHAFSLRSWKWRLEARATGKPFSEVVLLHSLVYRVEQVFLIHPETGLLLQHVFADSLAPMLGEETQYAAMVSSMLTAIQDFVRDSFRVESKAALDSIDVGELSVWIERGPQAVLACVIRGTAPLSLRTVLRTALESCHRDHYEALKQFSGDTEDLRMLRSYLEPCLLLRIEPQRRNSLLPWLLVSLVLLSGIGYAGLQLYREQTRRKYIESALVKLGLQPGVAIVEKKQSGRHYHVTALRDPFAETESELLRTSGLSAQDVTVDFRPFFAGEPSLILLRVKKALKPPVGVSLGFAEGTLTAMGTADAQWIADAKLVAPAVAGVAQFDCQVQPLPQPPTPLEQLLQKAQTIENTEIHFRAGSAEFLPGQSEVFQRAVVEIRELLLLADKLERGSTMIEVHAYTDDIGDAQYNLRLRESRSAVMLHLLMSAGIDKRHLRSILPLDVEQIRRVRAAGFRVVIVGSSSMGDSK